jgi:hypothetical protein
MPSMAHKYITDVKIGEHCKQEEIKSRLNSGNACYHSVQSLLSSRLLSRNVKFKIYKTIILPVRRIFGPKRDEVTEECRKLHNEELHILYSSPNIIRQMKSRRMRWAGHVARMVEERNVYRVLMGKPEEKRPLGRPRHRWDQNGS